MASQSAGFWIKGDDPTTLFQGTDETTPVTAFGDVVGRANDQRVGAGSPISSTQSTTSFRPKYQSTGLAFDGTDDNLPTNYTAGSGANFLIAKVVVPASLGAAQLVAGTSTGVPGRFFLGFNTAGQVVGGVGGTTVDTIVGAVDRRGTTVVVGISAESGVVRLFDVSAVAFEGAYTAAPNTTVPFRLGCQNVDGVATTFFGGSGAHFLGGREFIDEARFQQIANALGA
ncbi:hypothetical protein [Phenylobacterium sp.]|uniref:hypothetical protein n=1 Tax=Phenylobacterium sp. TaxID=1871053 RepID=UPI002614CE03|nr:hypothetical protein [Phenylobacterium sp.]